MSPSGFTAKIALPGFIRYFFEAPAISAARAIDEDIDPTHLLDAGGHCRLDSGGAFFQIERHDADFYAGVPGAQFTGERLAKFGIAAEQRKIYAFRRESKRNRLADAAAGAGDESHAALEIQFHL